MTASEKLMQLVLFRAVGVRIDDPVALAERYSNDEDADNIHDAESEVRGGKERTSIPCDYSRHYESKSVAAQMLDGSWVGWTYWYGGGKHGEPSSVPWIEDAYDVTYTEETQVVKVFAKAEAGR